MDAAQPEWLYGRLWRDPERLSQVKKETWHTIYESISSTLANGPIQQADGLKPFLLCICEKGLSDALHEYYDKEVQQKYDVIVIGAGMSGLVAAYELYRAGHSVTVLERRHCVGGRVKTIGETHFHKGLWADCGAMRLPGKLDIKPEEKHEQGDHYITNAYAKKFGLPRKKFVNDTDETYYLFTLPNNDLGDKIKKKDWNREKRKNCEMYWPGWNATLPNEKKQNDDYGIEEYFDDTAKPLINQLCRWLRNESTFNTAWERWITQYSSFSVESFLLSTYEDVVKKNEDPDDVVDLQPLKELLPWPKEAVTALAKFTYSLPLDVSLVWWLSNAFGKWWGKEMHTYEEGMRMLPEAFLKCEEGKFSDNIKYNMNAYEIKYELGGNKVEVVCENEITKKKTEFKADKVIIALPVNIIRRLTFSPPLPSEFDVLHSVKVTPLIKTAVQCRNRFWESEPHNITGGFTKTDLDIGQLLYPSNNIAESNRGVLMCYTWRSQPRFHITESDRTITKVVDEIAKIHPEILDEFESGVRQAWCDNNGPEGAYCTLKPNEYLNTMRVMMSPYQSIHFAGEAFSYGNGWIQGAIESGLRAAYQVHITELMMN